MQRRTIKPAVLFVLVLCFFFSFPTFGQTGEKQALAVVMQELEQKHNIRFSYVPEEIAGITVSLPEKTANLQAVLQQLNKQTDLQFTLLNNRYVTVVSPPKKSYCGRIIAADTGQPLEGTNVFSAMTSFSTVSTAAGFFNISAEIPPETTITLSYVGYYRQTLPVSDLSPDCPTIVLQPQTAEIKEVLIKTYLVQGISKQTDGAIELNINNLGLLPGLVENDVLQIAQALPGVESADETISNINIRGGSHFETLLLWDDIKIYQSGHFFGLISAFNPDFTQQVSIYKNGTPPRYGESVSGVIAMRSKNTVAKEFSGGVGTNLINGNAFAAIPLSEKASIQVSGRHSLIFFETPAYVSYSERMFQNTEITNSENPENETEIASDVDFSFYDLSTKLNWDISEKDAVRVNFLAIDNNLNFTESIGFSTEKTSELQQRSLVGGISWHRKWNPKIETTALAYGSYYLLNAINKDLFTTQETFQENEVLEEGLKLDSHFLVSGKTTFSAGYQFIETGSANTQDMNLPRFRNYKKEVLRRHSVFSNLGYSANQHKTKINAGARLSYFAKFDKLMIEPRLSVHQKLGNGFSVEAMGELKSQTTTQRIDFESDFLGVEKRRWVLSDNDDVPILESKQLSLGLGHNKDNWLLGLEGFYKEVSGITASGQRFQNQFQFLQAHGSYTAKGLEIVVNKKSRQFSTWFSYLFMQNDYAFETLNPSEFPNNIDIRHSATLAGTYTLNDLKFALGLNWHSGKPYTIPVPGEEIMVVDGQDVIQYDEPNNKRLPDYFRADFSAEYNCNISQNVAAKINVAVLNVLGTKNTLNIRYTLDSGEDGSRRINQVEEISLGLTPNVSVQVLF